MKYVVGVVLLFWLLSGLVGAAWQGELNGAHWKEIAKGPITLAKAYNDSPPTYPGPS